jgi:glycosyltransferase involved in cell wall biosynthesis
MIRKKLVVLLNGVDVEMINSVKPGNIRKKYGIPVGVPIILFVGRFLEVKGIWEFVETMYRLKELKCRFVAIMVGYGYDKGKIEKYICDMALEKEIILTGKVPQRKVYDFLRACDIYVSLCKFGSMGNTSLEAMAAARCMFILNRDTVNRVDETTENLIGPEIAIRVDRNKAVDDLTGKLAGLLNDPEAIAVYSKRMLEFSREFLWSWDERIAYEIGLLEHLAKCGNFCRDPNDKTAVA